MFIRGSADTLTPLHHEEEGAVEGEEAHTEGAAEETHAEGKQALIVPLFRAPSSDLNLTVGLALVSVFLTQVWRLGIGPGLLWEILSVWFFCQKRVWLGLD